MEIVLHVHFDAEKVQLDTFIWLHHLHYSLTKGVEIQTYKLSYKLSKQNLGITWDRICRSRGSM